MTIRSRSDLLVARILLEALDLQRRGFSEMASERVEETRLLGPDYFETFRVMAFIRAQSGDVVGAHEAYQNAVSLEPRSAPLRMFYGGFLLRFLDDADEAGQQFREAHTLDPEAVPIKVELARLSTYATPIP